MRPPSFSNLEPLTHNFSEWFSNNGKKILVNTITFFLIYFDAIHSIFSFRNVHSRSAGRHVIEMLLEHGNQMREREREGPQAAQTLLNLYLYFL